MAFSYYNKTEGKGVIATNLRAIEQVSKISYYTLLSWFRNGTKVKDTENFIILKSELIKGRQIAPPPIEPKQSSQGPTPVPEEPENLFDQLLK